MSEITWQEARDKVRERWPDAFADHRVGHKPGSTTYDYWEIISTSDWKHWKGKVKGSGRTEAEAWLNAYARMNLPSAADPVAAEQRIADATGLPARLTYDELFNTVASQASEMAALRERAEKAEGLLRTADDLLVGAEWRLRETARLDQFPNWFDDYAVYADA